MEWDVFEVCVFAIWKFWEGWDWLDEECDGRRGLSCVTEMVNIRDEYQSEGSVRYEKLLQAALHCNATDYRDMVFAFRGIGEGARRVPNPDYEVAVEVVYTRTASALLCYGGVLDTLALSGVGFRSQVSNLPSWVPDLRLRSYDEPFDSCDGASWDAGGPPKEAATVPTPNKLRLQVRLLDTVDVCCAPFNSASVIEQKKAMEGVMSLKKRLPHAMSESSWLNFVAESLLFGLDIDSKPVGPEYRKYFREWLAWLQSSSTQADIAKISSNEYQRSVGVRIDSWKAFMTKDGYFCIGPPGVEIGDFVCVVPGCRFPLVLRRKEREIDDEYILISWCYVRGIMHGEAMKKGNMLDSVKGRIHHGPVKKAQLLHILLV